MLSIGKRPGPSSRKTVARAQARTTRKSRWCQLKAPGWNCQTRGSLEELINSGAGKQLPVVFDFDNTIICGDVSEVTLAVLAKSGLLTARGLAGTLSPPFRAAGKPRLTLETASDITEYYREFLSPTAHGTADPSPLSNGYVWAVEVMQGLTPLDVIKATRTAFEWPQPSRPSYIEVTPGKTAFPVPFFYPEMVELMAELLRHRFEPWIVSAGNVWSIRWMILHALNPMLRRLGVTRGLRSENIIGVSTLLADRRDQLFKDTLLVRDNKKYAALDERTLASFRLTSRLQFPVSVYSGKVACILDTIGASPFLCIGDSPGDYPMMGISQNCLWIARLEKPNFQQSLAAHFRRNGKMKWMIQSTLTGQDAGFVPDLTLLPGRSDRLPKAVRQSLKFLARLSAP